MANGRLDQEIAIRLSSTDAEILHFLSSSWKMNVSEVIRTLIPKLPYLDTIKDSAADTKSLRIVDNFNRTRLSEILNDLITNKKAKTLATEIKEQLLDSTDNRNNLTGTTEARLLRWTHPARIDDRTNYVSPKAAEICQILYGFIPDRKK